MESVLNDTERLVLDCVRMRLTEKESLSYLMASGYELHRTQFYKIKGKLEGEKLKRLYKIGQYGFVDQHLERIDNLELIVKEMWKNYWKEKNPYRATQILKEIRDTQPYLSSYYEATKYVIDAKGKEDHNISMLGITE